MRHPVFLGLREDKSAQEVEPEEAEPREAVFQRTKFRTRAELTHLDKVFWPGEGLHQGRPDRILSADGGMDPPLPQGPAPGPEPASRRHHGRELFPEEPGPGASLVGENREDLASESKDKDIRYLVCQNRDTLLYEANLGCIETQRLELVGPASGFAGLHRARFRSARNLVPQRRRGRPGGQGVPRRDGHAGVLQDVRAPRACTSTSPWRPASAMSRPGSWPIWCVWSSTAGIRT